MTRKLRVTIRVPSDTRWLLIIPSNKHEEPYKTRPTTIKIRLPRKERR